MLIGPMISHSFWQKALLVGVRTSTMSFLTMKFCCGEYLFANTWNFIFRRWESCVLPLSRIWPVGTTLWVDTASCLSFRGCAGSRRPRPPPASPGFIALLRVLSTRIDAGTLVFLPPGPSGSVLEDEDSSVEGSKPHSKCARFNSCREEASVSRGSPPEQLLSRSALASQGADSSFRTPLIQPWPACSWRMLDHVSFLALAYHACVYSCTLSYGISSHPN
uniref:uncharacterized protein LOC118523911 isoform X1 n=1 Tax=Halichoerus grypus TaxID=9711 RepID=UPI001659A76D|nr:uncharacterized protein LOC118523911 isoform X1 [Halichoerus grypus]